MAEEGVFEPGCDGDLIPPLDVLGAGSIDANGECLRIEATRPELLKLVGETPAPKWAPTRAHRRRKPTRALEFDWNDVRGIACDSRDPRVLVIVVQHEGEARMVRFRPTRPAPVVVSSLTFMAENALIEEDDEELDAAIADLERMGMKVDIAACTGPGCKMCDELRAMHQHHAPS